MKLTRREFCQSAICAPAMALLLDAQGQSGRGMARATTPTANYMLRYFIRSETAKQQTEDLIDYCRQNHVPEVILYSGNHASMGWCMPTLDEARTRVNVMRPVFQRLRQAGLKVSITMWTTIGHGDVGRDERNRFSWQFMVGDDGAECHAVPCPIDPKWKSYVAENYRLNATLEPEIIYLDDDFRYHNHLPAKWGCFCPLHLGEMERRTGKKLTREELVHQILSAEPQPTIERQEWFKLCGDSIMDALRIISGAVMDTSPKTHMGLMCSDPAYHAAEGRRWLDMAEAMAVSGNKPVLRPTYGAYTEAVYIDVPAGITTMRKLQPLLAGKMRFTPNSRTGRTRVFPNRWPLPGCKQRSVSSSPHQTSRLTSTVSPRPGSNMTPAMIRCCVTPLVITAHSPAMPPSARRNEAWRSCGIAASPCTATSLLTR